MLAGITSPETPPHFPFYIEWLASGFHAGMTYLGTERAISHRQEPKNILPECQSILSLAIPYAPASLTGQEDDVLRGRVAAYAWGDDYHETLKPRLESLVRFIEAETGQTVPNRWYTDTGPVLERDLAQRAGLGWIGKNTCLIHPRAGSYFFLAEILLGIALEPDPPFTNDHCGSCTRCIDACPTGCILPERRLDANRCISFLTIENKGTIPEQLRPQIQDWVFGCDICQQVCPWNIRFALPPADPAFTSRTELAFPDLIADLDLTPQLFNRKFKLHPVKRAKRRGYLRNLAVALGNSRHPAAVPVLEKAVRDHEPLVRGHAAWALGEIGGTQAGKILEESLTAESNPEVLQEIRRALERIRSITVD